LALAETCVNVPQQKGAMRPKGRNWQMDKDQTSVSEAMDMPAHEKTYKNFTGFVMFGIVAVAIILATMAIFLT
jgi:Bacterial aa3 type cytochrome c oxidase subunit IV